MNGYKHNLLVTYLTKPARKTNTGGLSLAGTGIGYFLFISYLYEMKKVYSIVILVFINLTSFAQTWLWAQEAKCKTSTSSSIALGIAVDNSGHIYETGDYKDTTSFGVYTLTNGGIGNTYLVKYDANGSIIWVRNSTLVNSSSSCGSNTVSRDSKGFIYIAGAVSDTVIFSSDTIGGSSVKGFLAKYDSNGSFIWVKPFLDEINSITIDGVNNLYLSFANSANLIKCNSSGNIMWTKTSLSPFGGYSSGNCLASDNSGNVYMAGEFHQQVIIEMDTITSPGWSSNVLIARFDTAGNIKWLKTGTIPNSAPESDGISVVADNAGNLYLTGMFTDTISFDSYTFTNGNKHNVFLVKYSPVGSVKWALDASVAGNNGATGYTICTDQWNDIYLCGSFEDTMTMGGEILNVGSSSWLGSSPSFIVKLDSTGHTLCSTSIDNENIDRNIIAADPAGDNVYFSGSSFLTSCVFNSDTVTSHGYASAFLAKWTCGGGPNGMNELISDKGDVKVWPNPSGGIFNFQADSQWLLANSLLEVYNILGQKIATSQWPLANGRMQIDLSNQPKGIYFYRISNLNGGLVSQGKLVIQ